MTPVQKRLLAGLRKGRKFTAEWGNWTDWNLRRVRVETREALVATGELVQIKVRGIRANWYYICHKDCVEQAARGRPVLYVKEAI